MVIDATGNGRSLVIASLLAALLPAIGVDLAAQGERRSRKR